MKLKIDRLSHILSFERLEVAGYKGRFQRVFKMSLIVQYGTWLDASILIIPPIRRVLKLFVIETCMISVYGVMTSYVEL